MKAKYILLILFTPFFSFTQNIISINPNNGTQGENLLVEILTDGLTSGDEFETRLVLCDESLLNNSINSYEFFNDNNQSTVFYQGQSIRLNMFELLYDEFSSYETDFETLNNMFNNGTSFLIDGLNQSGKKIGNKTAAVGRPFLSFISTHQTVRIVQPVVARPVSASWALATSSSANF